MGKFKIKKFHLYLNHAIFKGKRSFSIVLPLSSTQVDQEPEAGVSLSTATDLPVAAVWPVSWAAKEATPVLQQ